MAEEKKVRYLWLRRCGDVSYSKAVQLVVTWAEEHDQFIKDLESSDRRREIVTERRRAEERFIKKRLDAQGAIPVMEVSDGDDLKFVPLDTLPKKWQWAQEAITELDEERKNLAAKPGEVMQLQAQITRALEEGRLTRHMVLPPYPELLNVVAKYNGQDMIRDISFLDSIPVRLDDDEFLYRLQELHQN